MKVTVCDRCGKACGYFDGHSITLDREGRFGGFLYSDYQLCNKCTHELEKWIKKGVKQS